MTPVVFVRCHRTIRGFDFRSQELRRQCQQFAVDLLDQTRSSEELAVILNHEKYPKCDISGTDLVQFPLLHLAIKYKQKKVGLPPPTVT